MNPTEWLRIVATAFQFTDCFVLALGRVPKLFIYSRRFLPFVGSNPLYSWKTQAWMTPGAKFDLTPENNLFLTPEEFGRRGQFYFGLSAFEGFEFTDAFAGERDTVCGVDDAVEDGIRHCGVADGVVPVQFGEL